MNVKSNARCRTVSWLVKHWWSTHAAAADPVAPTTAAGIDEVVFGNVIIDGVVQTGNHLPLIGGDYRVVRFCAGPIQMVSAAGQRQYNAPNTAQGWSLSTTGVTLSLVQYDSIVSPPNSITVQEYSDVICTVGPDQETTLDWHVTPETARLAVRMWSGAVRAGSDGGDPFPTWAGSRPWAQTLVVATLLQL